MAEVKKEEAVIDEAAIDKELKNLKEDSDQIKYLKKIFKDDKYNPLRSVIISKLVPLITKKPVATNKLVYDSLGEGLEPIYFWILDFMRDSAPGGLGMKVKKGVEEFESSASSAYFGEMGARATQMQQKAAEYLGAINQVVKSIVNLLYDLREFELRIKEYDNLKSSDQTTKTNADQVLRTIWMDQVDMKKGRGSINGLAQDLRFITLRDAFFLVNSSADVDKMDLNDRVKRILKTKLEEYVGWRGASESEVRKRYNIEKTYLKSQIGALELYGKWLRPYLKAAQKLRMKEFGEPDVVDSFSNMQTKLDLYGWKEVAPGKVHESFKEDKLSVKFYAVVDVQLNFRTVPQALQGQGGRHYIQGGRVDIAFNGYVLDEVELEALQNKELYEDLKLIEDYLGTNLTDLKKEAEDYFNPKKDLPKPEPKSPYENPFKGSVKGLGEMFGPLTGIGKSFSNSKGRKEDFLIGKVKDAAKKDAKDLTFKIYNIYKKTHKMIAW